MARVEMTRYYRSGIRTLGSLRVAVVLLLFGACALFLGALVESWHGGDIAQTVVYRAWWFRLWLVVLWINILAAAWKKRPWKKHQTGFLITHLGLLTLLAGGLLTNLLGESGSIVLVDNDTLLGQQFGQRSASQLTDLSRQKIWVAFPSGEVSDIPLSRSPWAWHRNRSVANGLDPLTQVLAWLALPFPAGPTIARPDGGRFEVVGFEPHLQYRPFFKASPGPHSAVRFRLRSPTAGPMPIQWLGDHPDHRSIRQGPVLIEFLGADFDADKLAAWKSPPADARLKGVLQFAGDAKGQLHFRSWTMEPAGPRPDREGLASVGSHPLWQAMQFRLEILDWLPRGATLGDFEPVLLPPGQKDPDTQPGLRCRWVGPFSPVEFWVTEGEEGTPQMLDGRPVRIGFGPVRRDLGFTLTLLRAEQTNRPGSAEPPGQSSLVLVQDGDRSTPALIRFNQPLEHAGYRIYQGPLQPLGLDGQGKPIHRVRLDVTNDPGLRMKYFGAAMVALGIATMFWMRAYPWPRKGK